MIDKVDESALDYESSRIENVEKSEKRAWIIAGVSGSIAAFSLVSIFLMMPLKETVPYVVRVDNATGVVDIVSVLNVQELEYQDIQDKYWIARYLAAREGYYYFTLQEDYDLVGTLSTSEVALPYSNLFSGDEPLDKQLRGDFKVEVKPLTISPNGKGQASVRFAKKKINLKDPNAKPQVTTWVATINYQYSVTEAKKESERLINPFGFTVTGYRVDPEMGVQ